MRISSLNWDWAKENRKIFVGTAATVALVAIFGTITYNLQPASASVSSAPVIFEIQKGQGFREIMKNLSAAGLLRSPVASGALSLLTGAAFRLQPGRYQLSPAMSAPEILGKLASGTLKEVTVTIPEGVNLYQIDAILTEALVIQRGELIRFADGKNLEGKLFPDTYRFFTSSDINSVVQKFLDNFNEKAAPLLAGDASKAKTNLILASIVDKEVPDPEDQKTVAGLLLKRLRIGMALNVDATICYIKLKSGSPTASGCYPLAPLDYKIDSPYNTYLYKGLPPGPIGNPGISAIKAVLAPRSSPYWYYLSDPKTGKTLFSQTLDEQETNKVKYLKGN